MADPLSPNSEIATLAGGCFWCLEAALRDLEGVSEVVSGYTGGHAPAPTYEAVCTGRTGHAEAVQVSFDPAVISYRDLLRVFFALHDPTTLNRQGADVGTQYRSAIFYHTPVQEQAAREVVAELAAAQAWPAPIVTEIVPLTTFVRAEDYHQRYFARHPSQGYCQYVIAPKLAKFRHQFGDRLRLS
jgi:peptide-methionine (S)-S-oxide reductase